MSDAGPHPDFQWARPTEVGDTCCCGGRFGWLIPDILVCDRCDSISFYHGSTPPHVFLARAIRAAMAGKGATR